MQIQKITPHLWFDNQAEDAAKYYVSIFSARPNSTAADSQLGEVSRYGKEGFDVHHMPEGTAMTVDFTLAGQRFLALNGGPVFKFNEAISFLIRCEDQTEIDYFWDKLSAVPGSEQCGWLKDKYGLSWQVIPKNMGEIISKPGAMQAMLQMKKIDIAKLQEA